MKIFKFLIFFFLVCGIFTPAFLICVNRDAQRSQEAASRAPASDNSFLSLTQSVNGDPLLWGINPYYKPIKLQPDYGGIGIQMVPFMSKLALIIGRSNTAVHHTGVPPEPECTTCAETVAGLDDYEGSKEKEALRKHEAQTQTPTPNQVPPGNAAPIAPVQKSVLADMGDIKNNKNSLTDVQVNAPCHSVSGQIYQVCNDQSTNRTFMIKLFNNGPSKAVPVSVSQGKVNRGRSYSFNFIDQARQDMRLSIIDSATDNNSDYQFSDLYFFPRKVLPTVENVNGKTIVTLPTKEKVIYDSKTGDVIDGALKESGPVGLHTPKVSYTGPNVMVRLDSKSPHEPRETGGAKNAVITKQGKTCVVSASSLIPDRKEGSGLHFKFDTDEGFNEFLTKNCPFHL